MINDEELSRLVAEKVMGWDGPYEHWGNPFWEQWKLNGQQVCVDFSITTHSDLIIDKMVKDGFDYLCQHLSEPLAESPFDGIAPYPRYESMFCQKPSIDDFDNGFGWDQENRHRAIAIAALRAKGVEV